MRLNIKHSLILEENYIKILILEYSGSNFSWMRFKFMNILYDDSGIKFH